MIWRLQKAFERISVEMTINFKMCTLLSYKTRKEKICAFYEEYCICCLRRCFQFRFILLNVQRHWGTQKQAARFLVAKCILHMKQNIHRHKVKFKNCTKIISVQIFSSISRKLKYTRSKSKYNSISNSKMVLSTTA